LATLLQNSGLRAANQDRSDNPSWPTEVVDFVAFRSARTAGLGANDLRAYVDAVLEEGRRAAVAAGLRRDREAGEAVAAYRAINVDLHRLFEVDLPPLATALACPSRELRRRIERGAQIGSWPTRVQALFCFGATAEGPETGDAPQPEPGRLR
jgi:hypothetical protein